MEGAIKPVLCILNEWMKNTEIGVKVTNNMEGYIPPSDIPALEKKWEGELRDV